MRAVNLIPSDERRGASVGAGRSGGAAYIVLGLLAGLALLAFFYGMAKHQVSSRRAKLASVVAATAHAQESASALTPYTSFIALREQRMQAVATVVDSRFDWAHAFHELGRVLPHDASISSISGSVGESSAAAAAAANPTPATAAAASTAKPAAQSATPPGSVPTMTLNGCASTQAEVALTLQRLRLIDGVSAVNLQSSVKPNTAGSSSSSGSTGAASGATGGQCAPGSPSFTADITFDPLPTPSASSSASSTRLTSSTGGGQ
jgi:hypothetical protein